MGRRLPIGPASPALVQVARYFRDPIGFLERCRARFGPTFTLRWPGMPPMVYFSELGSIAEVFGAPSEVLQAGRSNAVLDFVTGPRSVARLDGAAHRKRRRDLASPFCRLGPHFASTMTRNAMLAAERARAGVASFCGLSQALSLRNLVDCMLGMDSGLAARLRELVQNFMRESLDAVTATMWMMFPGVPLRRAMVRWLAPLASQPGLRCVPFVGLAETIRELDEVLYRAIAEARRRPAGDGDLLSLLVAQHERDEDLRDELMAILVAGHETTSTSMDWFMVEVLSRPELLGRLREEVDGVVGDGVVDASMVGRMPLLRATIHEVLRLRPPVPSVGRLVVEDTEIAGVALPAGVVVSPCIALLHRDPMVWSDPNVFSPERFLEGSIQRGSFIPFGGGTRTCLGKPFGLFQLSIVLATLLGRYDLRASEWPVGRVAQRGLFTGVDHGVDVTIRPRAIGDPTSPKTEK